MIFPKFKSLINVIFLISHKTKGISQGIAHKANLNMQTILRQASRYSFLNRYFTIFQRIKLKCYVNTNNIKSIACQSPVQFTRAKYNSPEPSTIHQSPVQFTRAQYNSPEPSTSYQTPVQFSKAKYNLPEPSTIYQTLPLAGMFVIATTLVGNQPQALNASPFTTQVSCKGNQLLLGVTKVIETCFLQLCLFIKKCRHFEKKSLMFDLVMRKY